VKIAQCKGDTLYHRRKNVFSAQNAAAAADDDNGIVAKTSVYLGE